MTGSELLVAGESMKGSPEGQGQLCCLNWVKAGGEGLSEDWRFSSLKQENKGKAEYKIHPACI